MKKGITLKNNQSGFTLVEIAIVLVIIGALLGSVMRGQELVSAAKEATFVNNTRNLISAVFAYRAKYKAWPGDDNQVTTRLPSASGGCSAANLVNGNNDGKINNSVGGTWEYWAAAEHLACAGFITGTYNGSDQPIKNNYDGNIFIIYDTIQLRSGNMIRFDNIPAETAKVLDEAMDDGIYNTGVIRSVEAYTPNTTISSLGYFL